MVPIAQPYSQDTCRIGFCAFAALGWAESWFGTDQVKMKWSPPNCFHPPTLFCCPISQNCPCLLSNPPQIVGVVFFASDGWCSARELPACRWPPIIIPSLLPNLCCQCRHHQHWFHHHHIHHPPPRCGHHRRRRQQWWHHCRCHHWCHLQTIITTVDIVATIVVIIVVIFVLLSGQSEQLDQTTPQQHCPFDWPRGDQWRCYKDIMDSCWS